MAKGNAIILSPTPRGVFKEGVITGTPKPGIVMQIDVSEGLDGTGSLTWEAFNADADGDQRLIAILLPDEFQGKTETDAYVAGDRGKVYIPAAGEEFNMLLADVAGTGDDHAFGELLMVDDGTGKLIATTGSPESECFQLLEAVTDPTADQLVHVIYTGY